MTDENKQDTAPSPEKTMSEQEKLDALDKVPSLSWAEIRKERIWGAKRIEEMRRKKAGRPLTGNQYPVPPLTSTSQKTEKV